MAEKLQCFIFFVFYIINLATTNYPPIGNEVIPGSVLLPATRRGRYLANIVRRQAVDGTGILFNKDADRINAESKKKVDVLSEELLPYIIAEQERRTTLYKRIMTAIQNGEKGITIVEMRSKPPVIIKKGLMYRCPSNRAPVEPDGSGFMTCEGGREPVPIIFDSCLSAEDKELFVTGSNYFFCNRHKVEGPDLPRNGSTVIGCAPVERTSLNYTVLKCALEDSDDVVIHYRYYPDRSYKYVTELDPDKEICDHWNPCQVGYIFSLPSPDQASLSSDLWAQHGDLLEEYERDAEPEDSLDEVSHPQSEYHSSRRTIPIPPGFMYDGVGRIDREGDRYQLTSIKKNNLEVHHRILTDKVILTMNFSPLTVADGGEYYARFRRIKRENTNNFEFTSFLKLDVTGMTKLTSREVSAMPGQHMNDTRIAYKCHNCIVRGVMLKSDDGSIINIYPPEYRTAKSGADETYIELHIDEVRPEQFGDYFVIIQNEFGVEEKIKLMAIRGLEVVRFELAAAVGDKVEGQATWKCTDCELTDVVCKGTSVLESGQFSIVQATKELKITIPTFEDENSCVYEGIFMKKHTKISKIMAVLENNLVNVTTSPPVQPPVEGSEFRKEVPFSCEGDCVVDKVMANGVALEQRKDNDTGDGRRNLIVTLSAPCFMISGQTMIIIIPLFTSYYCGAFQSRFIVDGQPVTKKLFEIEGPAVDDLSSDADYDDYGHPDGNLSDVDAHIDNEGGSDSGQDSSDAPADSSDGTTDGSDATSDGSDATTASSNDASDGSDATTDGSDATTDGSDATTDGSDATTGSSDGTTGGSDATTGGSDATTGGSDATTGGSDGTTGGSDATTGGSDATTGGSDATTDSTT